VTSDGGVPILMPTDSQPTDSLPAVLRIGGGVRAFLFDLDGVLTRTASLHAVAWKTMFDGFLAEYASRTGGPFVPFDVDADYGRYVDGRPRNDGTRTFLASRGIELPEGADDDEPGAWTVVGLGRLKNEDVVRRIRSGEVEVFEGSVGFVRRARAAGVRTAVVSSSANTLDVLRATGLETLFEARIDGVVARERGLPGKPAPDTFLAGAAVLGVSPDEAVVFEDATAGVEAGRAGGFALVVGVDRSPDPASSARAEELRAHGADLVVRDLSEIDLDG
jgi:beta-phosphoglucomutase family hydrolase